MLSKLPFEFNLRALAITLSILLPCVLGCTRESCNGAIESVVLMSKPEIISGVPTGVERIYVDVKNKGDIGIRKTLTLNNGLAGTFDNVVVIRDSKSKFQGKKEICFTNYARMAPTDGASMNDEGIPEIILYW